MKRAFWLSMMVVAVCLSSAFAQQSSSTASTPVANAVVPTLINFTGTLVDASGKPLTGTVGVTFYLFKDDQGGSPLWLETQNVQADHTGHYSVALGSTRSTGLPSDIFVAGEARWLSVQPQGQPELPRVMLLSVPYALKAGDAQTIGGLPPSAFMLAAPPNSGSSADQNSAPTTSPLAASNVTTTGGTVGTLPLWATATSIQSSALTQTGSGTTARIGVGTTAPTATLDVKGGATIRGILTLPATGVATATAGTSSQPASFVASSFSSSAVTAVNQTFHWQAVPNGNNTANPSATLNLLYGLGTALPAETGLRIGPKGIIGFAPGQTFPGVGTITGVTAGTDLTGGGTGGIVTLNLDTTKIPRLGAANTFTANQTVNGTLTATSFIGDGSALTNITATNASELGGVAASAYAQLGASNTFTAGQTINGASSVSGSTFGSMLSVTNTGGISSSSAIAATISGQYGIGISATASSDGIGIESLGTQTAGSIGVLGSLANSGGLSNSFFLLNSDDGLDSGIWADGPNGQEAALIATSDDLSAGVFFNDSSANSTILVLNNYSGGPTGLNAGAFGTVLRAEGPAGACGINQTGSISCTGQVKTLAATQNGSRQVETYSVQSAENWLEDYGSGQLDHGGVTVRLDPVFADTVNTGVDFHVFLTPGGDCKGLYVTNKTASSFEVHELGGGTTSISFDYKIVAKRRGHETERLVDVTDRMQLEANAAHFKRLAKSLPRRAMMHNQPTVSGVKTGNASTRQSVAPQAVQSTPTLPARPSAAVSTQPR
jgi:hypothetical protein